MYNVSLYIIYLSKVLCWSLATVVSRRTLPGLPSGQVGKPEPKWSWREHALPVTDIDISSGGVQVDL